MKFTFDAAQAIFQNASNAIFILINFTLEFYCIKLFATIFFCKTNLTKKVSSFYFAVVGEAKVSFFLPLKIKYYGT